MPPARRPPVPFPLDNAGPAGSVAADASAVATALRDWWHTLSGAVADTGLDDLAVAVFGLPDARRM